MQPRYEVISDFTYHTESICRRCGAKYVAWPGGLIKRWHDQNIEPCIEWQDLF